MPELNILLQLTFYDIPWPVAMPARTFDELQPAAIERFLLSPYHSMTKTRKMRLRAALMQWHPDVSTNPASLSHIFLPFKYISSACLRIHLSRPR